MRACANEKLPACVVTDAGIGSSGKSAAFAAVMPSDTTAAKTARRIK
jgi:hypothetical protein